MMPYTIIAVSKTTKVNMVLHFIFLLNCLKVIVTLVSNLAVRLP